MTASISPNVLRLEASKFNSSSKGSRLIGRQLWRENKGQNNFSWDTSERYLVYDTWGKKRSDKIEIKSILLIIEKNYNDIEISN